MLNTNRKILAVIGAGPKGLAIAVKAMVLAEFGLPADDVVLIEKHSVGANWSGEAGYTNGEMKLGTSPEKDVVFPLETEVGDPEINERVRRRLMDFTWTSFLVHTGTFSDWVDRGRPAPTHKMWASYLKWVSGKLSPHVRIIKAKVESIDINFGTMKWQLKLTAYGENTMTLEADRLMLTGPGKARLDFPGSGQNLLPPRTFDLESFWKALNSKNFRPEGKIAIVGTGENAASVLLALGALRPTLRVDLISPRGFVSTRAENYYENQFYSAPKRTGWKRLELADRIDFIKRTDLGVFSVEAMKVLNEEINHRIIPGRLVGLKEDESGPVLKIIYGDKTMGLRYDQVILATGFDQAETLRSLLTPAAMGHIEEELQAPLTTEVLSLRIGEDLSVEGLSLPLHLPMLAGLMEGPGFANLSCLGLLSDRIILRSSSVPMKAHFELMKGGRDEISLCQ